MILKFYVRIKNYVVFDGLLYNGMKETYEKQICFPTINPLAMKIVLEYTYTGSIKKESLTKDNIIEAFCAADYFQLPDLQNLIIKNIDIIESHLPELLSKVVDTMPLSEDNIPLNLFFKEMLTLIIPLFNTVKASSLGAYGIKRVIC